MDMPRCGLEHTVPSNSGVGQATQQAIVCVSELIRGPGFVPLVYSFQVILGVTNRKIESH
jgi:hypothetical protein